MTAVPPTPDAEGLDGTATHGVALALADHGLLVRGHPGSGKTALALAAIELFEAHGVFSALVADDGVVLGAHGGRLIGRCPPELRGLCEIRGAGVRPAGGARTLTSVRLTLVVDLLPPPLAPSLRWPEGGDARAVLHGIVLPRLVLPAATPDHRSEAASGAATLWWVLTTTALTPRTSATKRQSTRGDRDRANEHHRGTP